MLDLLWHKHMEAQLNIKVALLTLLTDACCQIIIFRLTASSYVFCGSVFYSRTKLWGPYCLDWQQSRASRLAAKCIRLWRCRMYPCYVIYYSELFGSAPKDTTMFNVASQVVFRFSSLESSQFYLYNPTSQITKSKWSAAQWSAGVTFGWTQNLKTLSPQWNHLTWIAVILAEGEM